MATKPTYGGKRKTSRRSSRKSGRRSSRHTRRSSHRRGGNPKSPLSSVGH